MLQGSARCMSCGHVSLARSNHGEASGAGLAVDHSWCSSHPWIWKSPLTAAVSEFVQSETLQIASSDSADSFFNLKLWMAGEARLDSVARGCGLRCEEHGDYQQTTMRYYELMAIARWQPHKETDQLIQVMA